MDFGAERHGFLPLKEITRDNFSKDPGQGRINIKDVLQEGQEIIASRQRRTWQQRRSPYHANLLASRYLVLMPNNPRAQAAFLAASKATNAPICAKP